jgi:DNA-binding transcriptional MocR family regulator
VRPALAHVIPNFQNPGRLHPQRPKRDKLLGLAAEYDFTIFEDDPYIAIRFEGEALPTMLSRTSGPGRLRVVVLQDGLPGHPRRLPR